MRRLSAFLGEAAVFSGDFARQVAAGPFHHSGLRLVQVGDLDSALAALEEIVEQGEGTGRTKRCGTATGISATRNCGVFHQLEQAFNGSPQMLGAAIGTMYAVRAQAQALMQMPGGDRTVGRPSTTQNRDSGSTTPISRLAAMSHPRAASGLRHERAISRSTPASASAIAQVNRRSRPFAPNRTDP